MKPESHLWPEQPGGQLAPSPLRTQGRVSEKELVEDLVNLNLSPGLEPYCFKFIRSVSIR